jgi:hypothetical protein
MGRFAANPGRVKTYDARFRQVLECGSAVPLFWIPFCAVARYLHKIPWLIDKLLTTTQLSSMSADKIRKPCDE